LGEDLVGLGLKSTSLPLEALDSVSETGLDFFFVLLDLGGFSEETLW
jgi:hypothetical protein